MRHYFLILAFGLACSESPATPPPAPISVTFVNLLSDPVTITAPGTAGTLVDGTSTIVFPGGTTAATWGIEHRKYSDGSLIPDDLSLVSILVADKATLEITNVIGTSTYYTPYIRNETGVPIMLSIVRNGSDRCIGTIDVDESLDLGYYRLDPTTEIRFQRAGSNCSGPGRYWDADDVSDGMFSRGNVILTATTPP